MVCLPQDLPPYPCIRLPYPLNATFPAHLILLDLNNRTKFGEQYRSLSCSLFSSLYSPVPSFILGPNTLFNTLFLNTLSIRSSLSVRDQVSYAYTTTDKIIFLYISIFKLFGKQTGRQNTMYRMIASIAWLQSALIFFLNVILICYGCSRYLNCSALYSVLSAFTYSPFLLLTTFEGSAFSFTVCTLPTNVLLSSAAE